MAGNFGTTWWGEQWLDSLNGIDYSNRLPRGRAYASKGAVRSFNLDKSSGIITAKVAGHYASHYNIMISFSHKYTESETETLISSIARYPLVISALCSRKMSPEICDIAAKAGVPIFPEDMRDLTISCSCPDFGNFGYHGSHMCKHIAAVIYIVASQIDANPFILFTMRGIDIIAELEKRGISIGQAEKARIPEFAELLQDPHTSKITALPKASASGTADSEGKITEALKALTFASIPESLDSITGVFSQNPPGFTGDNLREFMQKVLRKAGITAKKAMHDKVCRGIPVISGNKPLITIKNGEITVNDSITRNVYEDETSDQISVSMEYHHANSGYSPEDTLFRLFSGVPHKQEWARISFPMERLYYLFILAARITAAGAIIPELFSAGKKSGAITVQTRWKPAVMIPEIREITEEAGRCSAMTPDLVLLNDAPENISPLKTGELLLSIFITDIVQYSISALLGHQDLYQKILFTGNPVRLKASPENELLCMGLESWLSPFSINTGDWKPVIILRDIQEPENETEEPENAPALKTARSRSRKKKESLFSDDTGIEFSVCFEDLRENLRPLSEALFSADPEDREIVFSNMQTIGRLSEYCTEIQDLVRQKKNSGMVTAERLTEILSRSLPILKILGIRFIIPKSLQKVLAPRAAVRIGLSGDPGISSGFVSLGNLLCFDWTLAIGNAEISREEFRELLEAAGKTVRFRNSFVSIDPDEMSKMLQKLDKGARLSKAQLLISALSGEFENEPVFLDDSVTEAIRRLTAMKEVPVPPGITASLRPYQKSGFSWLVKNADAGIGSIIADDMGLGKTLQVLSALEYYREKGELGKKPALIVAPASLIINWEKETRKFAPGLTAAIYYGPSRKLPDDHYDILITTYGIVRGEDKNLSGKRFSFVIIDEAQAIKNSGTATSKLVKKLRADRFIAMSGTPVENRLSEYWSIMDFANPGLLGNKAFFAREFQYPIEVEHNCDIVRKFRKVTEPFILRRLKTDKSVISDLPDKIVKNEYCCLSPEQVALYQEVVREAEEELRKETDINSVRRKGLVLELIMKLKQICNAPEQYSRKNNSRPESSGKMDRLFALLDDMKEMRQKCLIFTQFREMGELLQKWITARYPNENPPDFLHGGVPVGKRAEMVDKFQKDRSQDVFILSLKAAGTGLNLTAASLVIHYDLWWNPAVENQATDRAYRIGQHDNVTVHRFIMADTFEERINDMIESKKELAELTVATGEKWLGDMSNAELHELFALSGGEQQKE